MNFLTFKIFNIKDVSVYLHWTWTVAMMFVAYLNPNMFLYILPIYFFVLLHELGHVFAAKGLNIEAKSIHLFPFGGIARIKFPEKQNSKKEFLITIAGPLVNLGLLIIFTLCQLVTPENYLILNHFMLVNLVLFVFNLLPLFPMDGGRLLRCILHFLMEDYNKATKWAVRIGQVLSIALCIFAFSQGLIMLCVITVLVILGGEMELRSLDQKVSDSTHLE